LERGDLVVNTAVLYVYVLAVPIGLR
jgi:hypothetical protein